MPQATLISFLNTHSFRNRWDALGRMGRPPIVQKEVAGLSFFKPLGTGSGNGFSIKLEIFLLMDLSLSLILKNWREHFLKPL